ncbi:MFS transporter [Caproiciproducens galactitolivorans]|uniref:MFS transporter n=1 Tax=Caproiciproducens galactitolivorans TaxID=642589 RepID=A0ABT4BRX6_9FIRM|nr:MFS transporter [Caproiciproducens galactitolivorans]MCY1713646.1 MFS transporter [Caproiciproducens galactitolivorans]
MKDQSVSLSKNDKKLIGTLCILIVYAKINLTMFNLAVPSISSAFSLSTSQVSWIMAGYTVILAVGAGVYSKLTGRFSFKFLYVVGLLLFTVGSLFGFLATSFTQVMIGRIIQATGAAAISPLSYGIVTRFFRSSIRGRVLGALSATIAFASGFGPVFGGFVEEYAGWHALFLVSGSCLLVLPFIFKYIPDAARQKEPFDIAGMVLFSSGITFFMLGITMNPFLCLVGLLVLGAFWIYINKVDHPFISAGLLKKTYYRRTLWIAFITFLCNTGLTFFLPIIMKSAFSMPTSEIGLLMIPGALAATLLGSAIGLWSDRYGSRRVLKISHWLMIGGFILLSFSSKLSPPVIALLVILPMIGTNGMLTASGKLISLTLDQSELGMGMGIFTLAYLLGGAFGPALVGRFIDLNMSFEMIYIILAVIGLVSFLLTLFVQETKDKTDQTSSFSKKEEQTVSN